METMDKQKEIKEAELARFESEMTAMQRKDQYELQRMKEKEVSQFC